MVLYNEIEEWITAFCEQKKINWTTADRWWLRFLKTLYHIFKNRVVVQRNRKRKQSRKVKVHYTIALHPSRLLIFGISYWSQTGIPDGGPQTGPPKGAPSKEALEGGSPKKTPEGGFPEPTLSSVSAFEAIKNHRQKACVLCKTITTHI